MEYILSKEIYYTTADVARRQGDFALFTALRGLHVDAQRSAIRRCFLEAVGDKNDDAALRYLELYICAIVDGAIGDALSFEDGIARIKWKIKKGYEFVQEDHPEWFQHCHQSVAPVLISLFKNCISPLRLNAGDLQNTRMRLISAIAYYWSYADDGAVAGAAFRFLSVDMDVNVDTAYTTKWVVDAVRHSVSVFVESKRFDDLTGCLILLGNEKTDKSLLKYDRQQAIATILAHARVKLMEPEALAREASLGNPEVVAKL